MKRLRVLTGTHAGAQLELAPGIYRIGAQPDADIQISDWLDGDLTLALDEDDVVRMRRSKADGTPAEEVLVANLVAVPFGDVVLCFGTDDVPWPRDLDLLAGLWQQPSADESHDAGAAQLARRPTLRTTTGLIVAGIVVASGLLAAGVMALGTQTSEAANVAVDTRQRVARLSDALRAAGLADLHAAPRGKLVVVRGMIATAADDAAARRIIERVGASQVVRAYDIAPNDVDNIEQSLNTPGTRVEYLEHGVFKVSGTVPSRTRFDEALRRVRADLDSNVVRIEVDVTERLAPSAGVSYPETVQSGGVHYVETTDGIKHLYPTVGVGVGLEPKPED